MSIAEKLKTIAENEGKVYERGHNDGYAFGYEEGHYDGYEEGKAEGGGDETWDAIQTNGEKTDYRYAFRGAGWTQESFKPKYDLTVDNGLFMFENSLITDLRPEAIGVTLRGVKLTSNWNNFLASSNVEYVGALDEYANSAYIFRDASKLKSVERFIARVTSEYGTNGFYKCSALTNITVEGEFGQTVSFKWSTLLSLASAKSILTTLKDYAGTDKEFSYTITLAQETWDLLDADGATSPTGTTWKEYVAAKCWNI